MQVNLGSVYQDAWRIYRLLFRRSVTTAAIVFALIGLLDLANDRAGGTGTQILLGLVAFAAGAGGPVLVQGALVEIVRNIHEGRRPEPIGNLFSRAQRRFWSLLWASIVYGLGVIFGLILLIVPGLLAASRWCLMAPLIMLEGTDAGTARRKSSELVRAQTWPVLGVVVGAYLLVAAPLWLLYFLGPTDLLFVYLTHFIWSSLTAPFEAHVLTVLYYRLTDPDRPVIHEDVEHWTSVWEGA
jgi:hypothetical protein